MTSCKASEYVSLENRVHQDYGDWSDAGKLQLALCFIERQGRADEFLEYMKSQKRMLEALCPSEVF